MVLIDDEPDDGALQLALGIAARVIIKQMCRYCDITPRRAGQQRPNYQFLTKTLPLVGFLRLLARSRAARHALKKGHLGGVRVRRT